eukprot:1751223-Pleurochrysis_carterae.AAC.4
MVRLLSACAMTRARSGDFLLRCLVVALGATRQVPTQGAASAVEQKGPLRKIALRRGSFVWKAKRASRLHEKIRGLLCIQRPRSNADESQPAAGGLNQKSARICIERQSRFRTC